jgi:DNA-binding XRE family transcriptional regulator
VERLSGVRNTLGVFSLSYHAKQKLASKKGGGGVSLKHKIVYWRTKRDLTQRELAEKVGISGPAIAAYETGKAKPRIETLFRLAQALDVEVSELFDP